MLKHVHSSRIFIQRQKIKYLAYKKIVLIDFEFYYRGE